MRIVHVVPSIANEASGPSYSVVSLCRALIAVGEEAQLAVLSDEAADPNDDFIRGFSLGYGPRMLGRSPDMRRWLANIARDGTVDVMHNHSLWMMPNVYSGWAARGQRTRLIISPRGTLSPIAMKRSACIKAIFWTTLQKSAIEQASCFHATSEKEYAEVREAGFRQPVAVIPNGIDIPPEKIIPHCGRRKLLFLGRIHPIKGIDNLLRAWQVVAPAFKEWDLVIAGPDADGYLETMQNLATQLELVRCFFVGPLFGDTKLRVFCEADLFVLATQTENFGIAVAEALAAGTPAIVTRGAPWEGLQTHRAGWWIDVGVDPLIGCLSEALGRSRNDLIAMGARGRAWMSKEYSWLTIGSMMAQTYRWVLDGGTTPNWVRLA